MSIHPGANSTRGACSRKQTRKAGLLDSAPFSVKFYSWEQDTYFYEMFINYIIKKLTLSMGKFLGDEQYRLWKEEPKDWEQEKEAPSVCATCTRRIVSCSK